MTSEDAFKEALRNGRMVESVDEMTEGYKKALKVILTVSADTELVSAPAYLPVSLEAPTLNARASCMGVIQDEIAHGHIAYRLLEDLGVDPHELVYERPPERWRNTYGFDQKIENFAELVTAHGFWDRAGICLLGDVHEHSSYGPWKRALSKVAKEEQFHLRHGETWMRRLAGHTDKTRRLLQDAVDWMFPIAIEWFGLPDDLKRHDDQLAYRIKGLSNDELRQTWLSTAVPLCEGLGLDVPAHLDEATGTFVLDYELPVAFDQDTKTWDMDEPITWDDVLTRWRGRGPAIGSYVEAIQSGRAGVTV